MKSFMKGLWAIVFLATLYSTQAQVSRQGIRVAEEDGTPSQRIRILKFPNASLTINGDGSASISFVGGGAGDPAMGGDLSGLASAAQIVAGAIVNADVSATAAIAQSKIATLTTDLGLKAPLASPTFTGTPAIAAATATTPAADDNDTSVATTAYVQTELTAYDTDTRTLSNKTFADLTVTGAATVGTIQMEGATANEFETSIAVVDPTADRTITLPDASGTILVSGGDIGAATATTPAADDNDTSVATTAALQTELTAYATDTVTFTGKTIDAGNNVFKMLHTKEFITPQLVDGTGCTIGATSTAIEYNHAIFSGTADQAANYAEWRLLVPNDLDNNVNLTARIKFKLNGADTGTHRYVLSMAAAANSASASTAPGTPINLDFVGDASGADGDVEGVGLTTLSGWTTPLGGAQGTSLWIVRLARDGDAAQDTSTVASTLLSLAIEYRITQ